MKEIIYKKILKETSVILIACSMILSMVVVTGNSHLPVFGRVGAAGILCSQQPTICDSDWIHFDDGTTVDSIGLTVGGTFEFAIRITPTELVGYDGFKLMLVRWHHGYENSPPHSGVIKIYDAGTSTSPGDLITSEPFTVPSAGWFEIPLSNPVPIDTTKDIWVSIQITHAMGEYPAGVGPGPVVAGKGGWISLDGISWEQLGIDIPSLDYNWNIWANIGIYSEPPAKPQQPQGSADGIINVEYPFSTSTIDPEGDQVSYQWDWDDGTPLDWTDYYDSGNITYAYHAWTEPGTYAIRVKAKDPYGFESLWSDPKIINISVHSNPILEIGDVTGGLLRVNVVIKNSGSVDAIGVNWSINLGGGLILFGRETLGRIAIIPAASETTVHSSFIVGFGNIMIGVRAHTVGSLASLEQEALVFLFFIR